MLLKDLYLNEATGEVTTSPQWKRQGDKVEVNAVSIDASPQVMAKLFKQLTMEDLVNTPEFMQYLQIATRYVRKFRKARSYIPEEVEQGMLAEAFIYAFSNIDNLQGLKDKGYNWPHVHMVIVRSINTITARLTREDYRHNKVASLDEMSQDNTGDSYNALDSQASMEAYILSTQQLSQRELIEYMIVQLERLITDKELEHLLEVVEIKELQAETNRYQWRKQGLIIDNKHRASIRRIRQKLEVLPKEYISQLTAI